MRSIFNVLSVELQREYNRRRSLEYKFRYRIDYNPESNDDFRKRMLHQLRLDSSKNYITKREIIEWRVKNATIL